MVEFDIVDKDEAENVEKNPPTDMGMVNLALKECGFGKFHLRLLFSSFVAHTAGVIATATTPYILPIAECDLDMNLVEKGVLNAIPYLGMIASCVVAGFLTDTFGRKKFLLLGFGGLFIFSITSGLSQTYEILITSKFFEGFLFAMSFSPLLTLTSEFCHPENRDRVMLVQSSFVALGQVVVALKSWGVLSFDWTITFFNGYFVLHIWNLYLLIFSTWALFATILYAFLPESPKYFVTQQRYEEARAVLIQVYKENTGKSADSFKYINLFKDKTKLISGNSEETSMKSKLSAGFESIKPIFRKPLLFYLLFFCSINFFTMQQYNVLRLWFPQLSTIVEHYRRDGADLCDMLDTYTGDLSARAANSTFSVAECVPVRSGTETYINAVVIGIVSLLPNIITSILVKHVGKKNLLIICGLICVGCTLALRWAMSKTELVSLYSTVVSSARAMISLTQTMVLEYFPTSGRSLAIGFIMMSGRIGTLIGNIMFPILLSMGCVVPFFTLAALLIGITSLSLFLPKKK
ncbi:synaptic vesicle glycoprotein 2A-like isoform X1 [Pieris napi]|uniref:synaptic vesicle glycoprotein 2A-like isoform X1 n=1 Tax=Pieris napi TaxID=78633 RepID=UPI001FBB1C59|nr:synaptic vesicle glycoprotein 2A-like isoform X1 [Pieris napi]